MGHIQLDKLSYRKSVKKWLRSRYGDEADNIWKKVEDNYNEYLKTCPDYGGSKNGHSRAIYGGLLHVLPLLCNSDYWGISQIHGSLIRKGTCGTVLSAIILSWGIKIRLQISTGL